MGSTSQTGREREREMFLIVILLISTAFGRPNSAQLQRSSVISDDLEAAELDILELEAGLSNLQALVTTGTTTLQRLQQIEGSFVAKFEGAKSYLKQANRELNDLADTTVRDSRDMILLLEDYDRINDPDLLEIAIDIMKDLMIETKERLEEARKKYNSASEAFANLYTLVKIRNQILDRYVKHNPSENFRAKQAVFKSKAHSFFQRAENIFEDINDNIYLINKWATRSEAVRRNIERFPAGYIYRYTIEVFKTGLLDMKNSAEQFLA